jgi:hypothetical protein
MARANIQASTARGTLLAFQRFPNELLFHTTSALTLTVMIIRKNWTDLFLALCLTIIGAGATVILLFFFDQSKSWSWMVMAAVTIFVVGVWWLYMTLIDAVHGGQQAE